MTESKHYVLFVLRKYKTKEPSHFTVTLVPIASGGGGGSCSLSPFQEKLGQSSFFLQGEDHREQNSHSESERDTERPTVANRIAWAETRAFPLAQSVLTAAVVSEHSTA